MQIFELYFNPNSKQDRFFGSFSHEPENSYEISNGNLYMMGDLSNALPQDSEFIERISRALKEKYYSSYFKKPNKALAHAMKAANDFLSEEVKKENVNWLGNLSFAALSVKDFNLSFAGTGENMKMVLLRQGQITDIGQNILAKEIEPYPLKVFLNIVSGKLMEKDIILVATKEIFDFLEKNNAIEKIANTEDITEKRIKEIISKTPIKLDNPDFTGLCFLAVAKSNSQDFFQKARQTIFERKKKSWISEIIEKIKIPKFRFSFKLPEIPMPKKPEKKRNIIVSGTEEKSEKKLKIKTKKINFIAQFKQYGQKPDYRKKIMLVASFAIILLLGFAVFKNADNKKKTENENYLNGLSDSFSKAQNNEALSGILDKLAPFIDEKNPKALSLKDSVESKLYSINNFENIENPEVFVDLDIKSMGFVPQTLLFSGSKIYLSSQISADIYSLDISDKKGEYIKGKNAFQFADDSSGSLLFFSEPDIVSNFQNNKLNETKIDLLNSEFDLMASYASNIYFINAEDKVIKYPYDYKSKWKQGKEIFGLKQNAKSLAIDVYFWLLNENNSIDVYYKGVYEKTLSISIFPKIKNLAKIKTKPGLAYLYLLEPSNNRIIVIDKNGNVIKQIESDKFGNLKDFSISENGKTIWILNAEQIYKVEL